jgi:hypothetical protein
MEMQAFPLLSPYVAVLAYGTASVRLSHARASAIAAFALNTCKTLLKKRLRLGNLCTILDVLDNPEKHFSRFSSLTPPLHFFQKTG